MKKIGLTVLFAAIAACGTDKFTEIQNGLSNFYFLRLTPEAASMAVGQTLQLSVTAYDAGPCGGATCNVLTPGNPITVAGTPVFKSSDTTKAKVSAAGVVTAIAAGAVNIIATLQDIPATGSGMSSVTRADTSLFVITTAVSTIDGMTLTATRSTNGAGSPDTLQVNYTNAGATVGTQKAATTTGIGATVGRPMFYSDHPEIATVSLQTGSTSANSSGIITGIQPGTATITAVNTIGGVTRTATFPVTITDPITATFSIQPAVSGTGIIFFPSKLTVSATEAVIEGKPGAVVNWTVVASTFSATSAPNSTECFNVTFANPSAALASGTGLAGNIGTGTATSTNPPLCSGTRSRLFTTPGTYTFTNTTNGATGSLIVK